MPVVDEYNPEVEVIDEDENEAEISKPELIKVYDEDD
jgi:hypothetical protein